MHEHHDEDLILDLLDDPVATDAEISVRLDGCEQCLVDLVEQRTIAGFLADLERPSLTGTERAELRTAVLAEVAPAQVIPLIPKRAWDWTRLGTVAAALVGVVAVAGLFSVIGGGGDGEAESIPDTVAAADEADADLGILALEAEPSADIAAGDAADDAAPDAAAEEAAEDLGGASLAPPSDFVLDLGPLDRPGLAAELDRIRSLVTEMTESSGVLQRYANGVDVSCTAELDDPGGVRAIVTVMVDGLDVEIYFDSSGGEIAYASMDCSTYDLP